MPDRKPDPEPTGNLNGWIGMSIQIDLHWNFSNMTIRSTKTGNRIENRTPDRPENFMNESVCHYKFICIKIFMIGPLEVQKPETGQKTGSRSGKFFSTKVAVFNDKFDGSIKFKIYRGYIWNFLQCQESHNNNNN